MKKQIAGVVFSLLISAEVFYGAQADQGDDLCKLGIQAYEQEKYEEAINYLAQASEMGNAEAQDGLGECYFNGYGIRSNPEKAAELFPPISEQLRRPHHQDPARGPGDQRHLPVPPFRLV